MCEWGHLGRLLRIDLIDANSCVFTRTSTFTFLLSSMARERFKKNLTHQDKLWWTFFFLPADFGLHLVYFLFFLFLFLLPHISPNFFGTIRAIFLILSCVWKPLWVDTMLRSGQEKQTTLCWFRALVAALLLCAVAVDGCPHKCSCSGSHVDCQGLGLKTVPKGIPRNAERL